MGFTFFMEIYFGIKSAGVPDANINSFGMFGISLGDLVFI